MIMLHAMTRLTNITNDQLCFLFGGKKVTFRIREFAIIVGLNCEPLKYYVSYSNRETTFKNTYFPKDSKLKVDNIIYVFMLVQNISHEDLVKLANLYFLEVVNLINESITFIDMDHVSMVKDLDDFYLYPWGTVTFANILRFINNAVKNNETRDEPLPKAYHLVDFPRAIVVFIFEIILALEEQEFAKRTAAHYPQRIANWNYEA